MKLRGRGVGLGKFAPFPPTGLGICGAHCLNLGIEAAFARQISKVLRAKVVVIEPVLPD